MRLKQLKERLEKFGPEADDYFVDLYEDSEVEGIAIEDPKNKFTETGRYYEEIIAF